LPTLASDHELTCATNEKKFQTTTKQRKTEALKSAGGRGAL